MGTLRFVQKTYSGNYCTQMHGLAEVADGKANLQEQVVEGTYEDTKSRELCGPGVSGESKVNVGLTQGNALSLFLFIAVVKLISKKICTKDSDAWPGSSSGRESKSPRTADRVERYVQQTWTESMFGEDGGNVGGTQEERAVNTPGWEEA